MTLSKIQPELDFDIDEIKDSFGVVMGEEADHETQLESENLKIEFNFEICQNYGKKTVKDQGYILWVASNQVTYFWHRKK